MDGPEVTGGNTPSSYKENFTLALGGIERLIDTLLDKMYEWSEGTECSRDSLYEGDDGKYCTTCQVMSAIEEARHDIKQWMKVHYVED